MPNLLLGSHSCLLAFLAALTAGCQAVPSTMYPMRAPEECGLHQSVSGVSVGIDTLTTNAEVRKWFGYDLTDEGLIPIHVSIANNMDSGANVMLLTDRVVLGAAASWDSKAQEKLQGRELSESERGNYAFGTVLQGALAGGLIGSVMLLPLAIFGGDSVQKSRESALQNRMAQLALRSDTLRPGVTAHGFLYFRARPEWGTTLPLAITLTLKNSKTGELIPFLIDLPQGKRPAFLVAKTQHHSTP